MVGLLALVCLIIQAYSQTLLAQLFAFSYTCYQNSMTKTGSLTKQQTKRRKQKTKQRKQFHKALKLLKAEKAAKQATIKAEKAKKAKKAKEAKKAAEVVAKWDAAKTKAKEWMLSRGMLKRQSALQDDECDTGDEGDDWDHSSVQGDDIGDEPAYFLSRLSTIALAEGIKDFTDELAKRTRK